MKTEKTNDGGPAFPNVPSDPQISSWDSGMTLRDYLAAKAMQAMLSNPRTTEMFQKAELKIEHVAKLAYSASDCMLAERNREEAK